MLESTSQLVVKSSKPRPNKEKQATGTQGEEEEEEDEEDDDFDFGTTAKPIALTDAIVTAPKSFLTIPPLARTFLNVSHFKMLVRASLSTRYVNPAFDHLPKLRTKSETGPPSTSSSFGWDTKRALASLYDTGSPTSDSDALKASSNHSSKSSPANPARVASQSGSDATSSGAPAAKGMTSSNSSSPSLGKQPVIDVATSPTRVTANPFVSVVKSTLYCQKCGSEVYE